MRTRILATTLAGLLAGCGTGTLMPGHEGADDHSSSEWTEAFEQSFREKDDPKADTGGCSGVRVPDQSSFGRRVALTFDDGPNPETTPLVLETLRRHGIPATFFINGVKVRGERERAILRDIASDPSFILASHTWSHENMARLSSSSAASQLDRNTEVLQGAGVEPRWFRFPFGSSTCETMEAVKTRGYTATGWHVDTADWCFAHDGGSCRASTFRYVPDSFRSDMAGFTLHQIRQHEGGIVLFHDIHGNTARSLEGIIQALLDEGYTFTRIDDASTFPKLNGTTAPPAPFVGDTCTGDEGCGFTSVGAAGFCHGAGFCSLGCAGACPDQAGKAPTFCTLDPASAEPRGICVSKATDLNRFCAALPGTIDASVDRFVGDSGARPATAEVCLPKPPGS